MNTDALHKLILSCSLTNNIYLHYAIFVFLKKALKFQINLCNIWSINIEFMR